jgi:hypothetical protein
MQTMTDASFLMLHTRIPLSSHFPPVSKSVSLKHIYCLFCIIRKTLMKNFEVIFKIISRLIHMRTLKSWVEFPAGPLIF